MCYTQDERLAGATWKVPETVEERKEVVYTRCYSLRNYGRVDKDTVEELMPAFDFNKEVGSLLQQCTHTSLGL